MYVIVSHVKLLFYWHYGLDGNKTNKKWADNIVDGCRAEMRKAKQLCTR